MPCSVDSTETITGPNADEPKCTQQRQRRLRLAYLHVVQPWKAQTTDGKLTVGVRSLASGPWPPAPPAALVGVRGVSRSSDGSRSGLAPSPSETSALSPAPCAWSSWGREEDVLPARGAEVLPAGGAEALPAGGASFPMHTSMSLPAPSSYPPHSCRS